MEEPSKYLGVVYDWNFAEFDSWRGFSTIEEAFDFAKSATESAIAIALGTIDERLETGKLNKPIAFFWCGQKYTPE